MLIISFELNYIEQEKFNVLNEAITEIQKIIKGLVSYIKQSDLKGSKFMSAKT